MSYRSTKGAEVDSRAGCGDNGHVEDNADVGTESATDAGDGFTMRTEVLGDIRYDGKTQVLLSWMRHLHRVRPKGVRMIRLRSCPEA